MRLLKSYGTHNPILIQVLQNTTGPILELGAGPFSTPLIHWLCAESGRKVETYDDEKEYFDFADQFKSRNHKILLVKDWDTVGEGKHWGVVFIDHKTERRAIDALRLKDFADYIILHDSETDHYGYSQVYPHFKYVYQWDFCEPWTAVLSNIKQLPSH